MPPLPFTVSAQSWYPRIAAFPGSEKSPVCDREIPITIGAVEALPLTLLEELAPLLLEHAASSPATRTATNDPPRLCAMARSSPSVPRCAIVLSLQSFAARGSIVGRVGRVCQSSVGGPVEPRTTSSGASITVFRFHEGSSIRER